MLVVVLWTVALLALIGGQVVAGSRRAVAISSLLTSAAAAAALADGVVYQTVFHLLDPSPRHWSPDGSARTIVVGGGATGSGVATVVVLDHDGRINPSLAPPAVLDAILRREGVDDRRAGRLSAAIADWVTAGERPLPGGAKTEQYRAAGLPYGPPGEGFVAPEDLGLVLGMTPDVLRRLLPHITVWNDGAIDPAHADPVVAGVLRGTPPDGMGFLRAAQRDTGGPSVVEIIVDLRMGAYRAMRRAVVRIDPRAEPGAEPWHLLAWQDVPGVR